MKCFPIPSNESQRIAALYSYEVLDSEPEVEFDTLTRLASQSLKAPAAVVGLMDADRLWFKSQLGLGVPQLDREIAFCAYAIMQPGKLLVIEDMHRDPRFQDNPLVTKAPNIRFYAGAPLVDHNDLVMGTIAVVDTKPRNLGEGEEWILQDLATLVMTALDQRRKNIALSKLAMTDFLTGIANRAQFERALEASIAYSRRTGTPFTLLNMDLNGFKLVNDTYGHPAGDQVLREVARRLQDLARTEEIVARLGGDEFAVIVRTGSIDSLHALIQRISDSIKTPITLFGGAKLCVSTSVGIATYSGTAETMNELITRADADLYRSKRIHQSDLGTISAST